MGKVFVFLFGSQLHYCFDNCVKRVWPLEAQVHTKALLLIAAVVWLIRMAFKLKHKSARGGSMRGWPAKFRNFFMDSKRRRKQVFTLFSLGGLVFLLYILGGLFGRSHTSKAAAPQKVHGYYLNDIQAKMPLIFPKVQDAPILKELKIKGLFILRIDVNKVGRYVLKESEPPMTEKEKAEITDSKALAKRMFLDHGKMVYRKPTDYPEVVIVTLIDFDYYDQQSLLKIVQNRVNYAVRHKYGVYVRWAQEFIPAVQKQNVKDSYDSFKPLIMRAAIYAFPQAKYFWFLDQDALIAQKDISLQSHLLNSEMLDASILRSVPVVAKSNIKTYEHLPVENIDIIYPQTNDGEIDTSSFIVTPSVYSKAFLDYSGDPLVRGFDWNSDSHCIGHILQWHPTLLARTALVVPKTIASVFDPTQSTNKKLDAQTLHYTDGDLVVSFSGCRERGSCAQDVGTFYEHIEGNQE